LLVLTADTIAPLMSAPADTTVNYGVATLPVITGYPAASDNSGFPPVLTYADSSWQTPDTTVSGHYNYHIHRTWIAADNAGNTRSVIQDIQVVDTTRPLLTAPAAVHAWNDTGSVTATVQLATPVATDQGGIAAVTSDAPAVFQAGTTVVTWTATDYSGNSTTATQTVTVDYQKSIFNSVTIFAGTANNAQNGRRADLRAELFLNGTLIGSGTLLNQQLFGNSLQNSQAFRIPLNGDSVIYTPDDILQLRLSARRASGSDTFGVHVWYNADSLNAYSKGYSKLSKYTPTGSGGAVFFLGQQYLLQTAAGNVPKGVLIKAVSTFQEIATWSTVKQAISDTTDHRAPLQVGVLSAVAYPNPSRSDFTLTVKSNSKQEVRVLVMDFFGREVKQLKVPAGQVIRFGNDLNNGVYFVIVKQGVQQAFLKLIKQ
jgi:hypothetical protein